MLHITHHGTLMIQNIQDDVDEEGYSTATLFYTVILPGKTIRHISRKRPEIKDHPHYVSGKIPLKIDCSSLVDTQDPIEYCCFVRELRRILIGFVLKNKDFYAFTIITEDPFLWAGGSEALTSFPKPNVSVKGTTPIRRPAHLRAPPVQGVQRVRNRHEIAGEAVRRVLRRLRSTRLSDSEPESPDREPEASETTQETGTPTNFSEGTTELAEYLPEEDSGISEICSFGREFVSVPEPEPLPSDGRPLMRNVAFAEKTKNTILVVVAGKHFSVVYLVYSILIYKAEKTTIVMTAQRKLGASSLMRFFAGNYVELSENCIDIFSVAHNLDPTSRLVLALVRRVEHPNALHLRSVFCAGTRTVQVLDPDGTLTTYWYHANMMDPVEKYTARPDHPLPHPLLRGGVFSTPAFTGQDACINVISSNGIAAVPYPGCRRIIARRLVKTRFGRELKMWILVEADNPQLVVKCGNICIMNVSLLTDDPETVFPSEGFSLSYVDGDRSCPEGGFLYKLEGEMGGDTVMVKYFNSKPPTVYYQANTDESVLLLKRTWITRMKRNECFVKYINKQGKLVETTKRKDYPINPIRQDRKVSRSELTLSGNPRSYYWRALSELESWPASTERRVISVNITVRGNRVTSGSSVDAEFKTTVLREFQKKHMVQGRFWHFKSEFYEQATNELELLGEFLSALVPWNIFESFPLLFLICFMIEVLQEPVSVRDLEYFAEQRDPVAFRNLSKMANDHQALLESDFESYEAALMAFCELEDEVPKYQFLLPMVRSFGEHWKTVMNGANLGSISGFLIDRDSQAILRDAVCFEIEGAENKEDEIRERLLGLKEDEFKCLLSNWSGTPVPSYDSYQLKFKTSGNKKKVSFKACFRIIVAERCFLDDLDTLMLIMTSPTGSGFNMH